MAKHFCSSCGEAMYEEGNGFCADCGGSNGISDAEKIQLIVDAITALLEAAGFDYKMDYGTPSQYVLVQHNGGLILKIRVSNHPAGAGDHESADCEYRVDKGDNADSASEIISLVHMAIQ